MSEHPDLQRIIIAARKIIDQCGNAIPAHSHNFVRLDGAEQLDIPMLTCNEIADICGNDQHNSRISKVVEEAVMRQKEAVRTSYAGLIAKFASSQGLGGLPDKDTLEALRRVHLRQHAAFLERLRTSVARHTTPALAEVAQFSQVSSNEPRARAR
jgi:hypothetical protein